MSKNLQDRRDELAKEAFGHGGVGYGTMHHALQGFIDKFIALEDRLEKQDDEDMIVYGYCVVDREGKFIKNADSQQQAIDFAADATESCVDAGIDWDYRVAAIVDQGGL